MSDDQVRTKGRGFKSNESVEDRYKGKDSSFNMQVENQTIGPVKCKQAHVF